MAPQWSHEMRARKEPQPFSQVPTNPSQLFNPSELHGTRGIHLTSSHPRTLLARAAQASDF